jgi:hypothetical protein
MIPGQEGEADSCYALYGHYSDPKYQATSWREAEAACAYEVLYLHFLSWCALAFCPDSVQYLGLLVPQCTLAGPVKKINIKQISKMIH